MWLNLNSTKSLSKLFYHKIKTGRMFRWLVDIVQPRVFDLEFIEGARREICRRLTYSCDHGCSKHSGAGEFPEAVRGVVAFQTQAHL